MTTTEIRVPMLRGIAKISVGRWFKRIGEAVTFDEPVVEIIGEGITQEVLAPTTGVLSEILVRDGDSTGQGSVLGRINIYKSCGPQWSPRARRSRIYNYHSI